jgi:hypothetical protein
MLGGEGSDDWLPGVFVRNPTLRFDHGVKNRRRNVYGERGYACLDRGLDLGTGLESLKNGRRSANYKDDETRTTHLDQGKVA